MEPDFWHARWQQRQIGFHQADIHPLLRQFWATLNLPADSEVLVPLCGKSKDMLWLHQQGHAVLGVELSEIALREFVDEHQLSAAPVQHDHYCGYDLADMTLLCGDFFHLSAADCAEVRAVYDRAALVALPPEMRQRYVEHMLTVLPGGCQLLLISMESAGLGDRGPPFMVNEAEIREHFRRARTIELLHTHATDLRGVPMAEKVYRVKV